MRFTRLLSALAAISAIGLASPPPATAHDDAYRHRTTFTERFCAHVLTEPEADTPLLQTLHRDDVAHAAVLAVSLVSTVALHKPFVVSCAFADSNGNGRRDDSERIYVQVLRKAARVVNEIDYRRRIAADPSTSVCVLSIVLDGSTTHRLLVSATACVVNPAAAVPESPMVALLGLSGLGIVVVFGWRRRAVA